MPLVSHGVPDPIAITGGTSPASGGSCSAGEGGYSGKPGSHPRVAERCQTSCVVHGSAPGGCRRRAGAHPATKNPRGSLETPPWQAHAGLAGPRGCPTPAMVLQDPVPRPNPLWGLHLSENLNSITHNPPPPRPWLPSHHVPGLNRPMLLHPAETEASVAPTQDKGLPPPPQHSASRAQE